VKVGDLVRYMSRTVLVLGYTNHNGALCGKFEFDNSGYHGFLVGVEVDSMRRRLYDVQMCEMISEAKKSEKK
jgi:hypothetical protein